MEQCNTRREFLKAAGFCAAAGTVLFTGCQTSTTKGLSAAPMTAYGNAPKDLIRVGFVGTGNMGTSHVSNLTRVEGCQIVAICDIRPEMARRAAAIVTKAGFPEPKLYTAGELDFVNMCESEDLDLVYNAAPWHWHTPICLAAMKNGKHAASEVNIALSVEDCWQLVETSEKTRRHCVMMENCCYDSMEMMTMNMIRQGLFGTILHGRCGYLHDLRDLKLSPTYYQGQWRLHESIKRDGNLYPTHGIGPMAWCMDIHRGDAFDTLVSMSTASLGLNEYARIHYPDSPWVHQKFALGDVNVCMIKTKLGKTILCTHDTNLPRPYSRYFMVQGTKGLVQKYPSELVYIEGKSKPHEWQDLAVYSKDYEHPVWKQLREKSAGAGHGGMDFIEDWRLIQALRKGLTPDIDVYDSVAWSVIIPLSEQAVAAGGKPVKFPDFTRGLWQQPRPLQVDTHPDL